MIAAIHQPEHLPWLGFFDKVSRAQTLVLLDHVQFRKSYFQNRNRIRSNTGSVWLTVPVLTHGRLGQPLNKVEINNAGAPRWREKYWGTLRQQYQRAPHWARYAALFEELYTREWRRLAELNETIIRHLLDALAIEVEIVKSSCLGAPGHRSELVLELCRRVGAKVYVSGISGRDYLDLPSFERAGIEVRFQDFRHPIYRQLHGPFLPGMSALDLLFNHGPDSRRILLDPRSPRLETVFA